MCITVFTSDFLDFVSCMQARPTTDRAMECTKLFNATGMQDDDSPSNTTQADMAEPGASATERGNDGGSVEPAEEEPLEGPGTDDDSSTLDDINDVEDLTGGVTDTADDPSAVVPDAEDTGGMMPDNSEVLDVLAPSSGLEAGPMGSPTAAEGPLSEALGVDTAPSMAPSLISVVDTPAQVPAPETALPILVPIQAPTPAPALAPDPVLIPAPAPVPLPVPAPAPAPAPTAFSFGPSNTWSTLQDVPLFMGAIISSPHMNTPRCTAASRIFSTSHTP